MNTTPGFVKLHRNGELNKRAIKLTEKLNSCTLCARNCGVNRTIGELGYCKAGAEMVVSSAFPHFGEEAPLVGIHGSGTIFLSNCNLLCSFCQNYEISHYGEGRTVSPDEVAKLMLNLMNSGCHNINFVTPTHYTPQIVEAVSIATANGFNLPLVYNCGGYESIETLTLSDGIFDIYMPDCKFADPKLSKRYCNAEDYFEVNQKTLKEMYRQVGDLKVNEFGIAVKGLLIRHLVMPNAVEDSKAILEFIATEISKSSYVNIMAQYRPCFQSTKFTEIARRVNMNEVEKVITIAKELGLRYGFD